MSYIYEFIEFNKVNCLDYGVRVSGGGTFDKPVRSTEIVTIPGRNGTLEIDNKRYENVNISYSAFIYDKFNPNYEGFAAYMLSQKGYKRLEDTYHPDHFRLARYTGGLRPKMTPRNKAGEFEITFDCKPQFFLKEGEKIRELENGQKITNWTFFDALPFFRLYGAGTLTVNDITITITAANEYTDVDSDTQEAYKGSTNCNGNITLNSGKFPVFKPGENNISFTGFTRVLCAPRWWTL